MTRLTCLSSELLPKSFKINLYYPPPLAFKNDSTINKLSTVGTELLESRGNKTTNFKLLIKAA